MPGRRAGSGVGKYNAESPKQDSKRFNSITKTIHFAHLGILYYLSMLVGFNPPPLAQHPAATTAPG